MKKYIFTLVTFLFSLSLLNSTIITVSNNPAIPAQYTDLQEAIDDASPGDTIYVHGSSFDYGTADINKELHLIGAGFHPLRESSNKSEASIEFGSEADNSSITGFDLYSVSRQFSSIVTNHYIVIQRCYVHSYIYISGNNWLIRNNILEIIDTDYLGNIIISNNVFTGRSYNQAGIKDSDQSSVIIKNNIFINPAYSSLFAFQNVENAVIYNNIFFYIAPSGCENCIFNNNLTYQTEQNSIPYGNNSGSDNIIGEDPLFVDAEEDVFSIYYNYQLQETSPGHEAGTDDTDIGLYGGSNPWPEEDILSGEPAIPQVRTLEILNTTVGQDGEVRFKSNAEKND